jgi:hypothetical protein
VHALLLWRASIRVDVVNVAVQAALSEGRAAAIPALLSSSGRAPYLDVAGAVARAVVELRPRGLNNRELRKDLRHVADVAVAGASHRIRRHAWLDLVSLAAIAFAGIDAAVGLKATEIEVLGLFAATLLWIANVRAARTILTRNYAGALALIDGVAEGLSEIEGYAVERGGSSDA